MSDYEEATKKGFTKKDRWVEGTPHHPMTERLMNFLIEHDYRDYGDSFDWSVGGDGDNGETLKYQLDAFFEHITTE